MTEGFDMTMKGRMMGVIRGYEIDRVPFVQYANMVKPDEDAWTLIGKDNLGILAWTAVHELVRPNCAFSAQPIERGGLRGEKRFLQTPAGTLTQEVMFEPVLGAECIKKHFIVERKDYDVFLYFLRDTRVRENLTNLLESMGYLGENGLPHISVGRTAYQQLWVEWVGLENLCLHMADWPDILEEIISQLNNIHRRIFRIVRGAADRYDLPYAIFPDNITAPVVGKQYFRKYCVPMYNELADMLAEKGIPVGVHMDGNLKPLRDEISSSRVQVLDSFSPQPDNDTSVAEAVTMWPNMRLLVNFPSSVHLKAPDIIYQQAMQILSEGGHTGRLWIQISENMPPGAWRKSYPEIVRAIHDFGKVRISRAV